MNKRGMVACLAALSMALFFVAPALAHHKDGRDRGGASAREDRGEQGEEGQERRPDRDGDQASEAQERDDDENKGSSASSAGRDRRPDDAGRPEAGDDGGPELANRRGGGGGDADRHEAATHPPGNNGTVKIDAEPLDDHPDNEPHVGCVFQIDFYGYDEGDLSATYELDLHPPTDGGVIHSGSTFIGEDPAAGGTDLDASVTIDLTDELLASGMEPHPIQGYHIKLTVHAEGSIGADVKHKVFWVRCAPVPPQVSAEVEEIEVEEEEEAEEVEAEEIEAQEEQEVLGVRIGPAAPGARPAPARVAAVEAQQQPQAAGALPVTGVPLAAYVLAALGLIGSGIALTRRYS